METFPARSRCLDALAGDLLDPAHAIRSASVVRQPDLAADHDAVGGGESFAGHTGFGFFGQKRIEHGVGNPVADLVRVAFGDDSEVKV